VRVRGTPGIAWAENLIYSFGHLKLPNGSRQWAHVVGFDPRTGIGGPWEMVQGDIAELTRPGTYVIDRTSLARFHGARIGDRLENFDHEVELIGMSDGARSCTPNPVVFTSFRTAQEHLPLFAQKSNFIVAEFEPGADRAAVLERLARLTNFEVLSKEQFSNRTRRYWATRTGIGIGIGVTIALGFIVGLVFVGQTMYSSTMDRLEEYAALKILGATNLHICAIIWFQACLLAVLGYAIGGGTGFLLQRTYTDQVVSMHIPAGLLFALAIGTIAMCLGASLLSVARVLKVAPSSLFRV
jgi:putative ABC transport system permease protein